MQTQADRVNKLAPIQIFLGLTYNCNLSCEHCYVKKETNKKEFSTKKTINILTELHSLGTFKIVFTHGESLLRKDILTILSHCKNLGLHTTILSNGIKLTNKTANNLSNVGLSKVLISLDSLNKEYHDKNRGMKGAWESAIKAMDNCRNNNISFGINVTLNETTIDSIEDFVKFAISKNAKEIDFLSMRPTMFEKYKSNKKWEKNYPSVVKRIWNVKKKYKSKIIVGFHDPLAISILKDEANGQEMIEIIDENECQVGGLWASIIPSGDVYPCNFLPIYLGNVYKNNFEKIWDNENLNRRMKFSISEKCNKCNFSSNCSGGCKAYSCNDSCEKIYDPRCRYIIK